MEFFKKRRERDFVDLTERYKKQQETKKEETSSADNLGFLGELAGSTPQAGNYQEIGINAEERKRKLAKRLKEMTDRMEELSNQIYHLQQRIELLERKAGVKFE